MRQARIRTAPDWQKRLAPVAIALVCFAAGAVPTLAMTDLSTLLADPPSSDWVEAGPSVDVLSGPFTAHDYAAYLAHVNGSAGTIESELTIEGFAGGYAKEWDQRGSGDQLVERVFAFGDGRGARSWYDGLKVGAQTAQKYKSDIQTLGIPNSFGVEIAYDGGPQWRVEFFKGNAVFVVHGDVYSDQPGGKDDLSGLAAGQARTEYDNAPAYLAVPNRPSVLPSWLFGAGEALIAGVLGLTAVVVAVIILTRRRQAQVRPPIAPRAFLSPDGRYWWDGTTWRPIDSGSPPD